MSKKNPRHHPPRRDPYVHHGAVGRSDDGDAFIRDPSEGGPPLAAGDIAERLAEEFVQSATSGEEAAEDARDEWQTEEIGGPFIETRASEEFADDVDQANPEGTEPAAFPTANASTK